MSMRLTWVAGLIGAGVAVACGDSASSSGGAGGSGGSAGTAGISVSDLPEAYAGAICSAIEECMGGAFSLILGGQDCGTRLSRQVNNGDIALLQDLIDDGKVVYRPELAQACLDSVMARGCDAADNVETAECQAALDGTAAEGSACVYDVECQADRICVASAACPGTCQPRGNAGAACEQDGDCGLDLACSDAGLCIASARNGQACGGTLEAACGMGQLCLGADEQTGATGTCTAMAEVFTATEGQPCSISDGPWCTTDLSCAFESVSASGLVSTCRARVASGAACAVALPEQCPDGEFCEVPPPQPPDFSLTGTCKALPGEGQPCAQTGPSGADGVCGVYLYCDAGTCRALGELGASCTSDAGCWSETCVDGTCAIDSACN